MDSIKDLLSNIDHSEPPEVAAIKEFMKHQFKSPVGVMVQSQQIVITVASASLAGALRLRLPQLQQTLATDKRLVIRIGQ